MATPRYDNCPNIILCVIYITFALGVATGAGGRMPTQMGVLTCNSLVAMTPEAAQRAIDPLLRALHTCPDGETAWRIRYQVGVIHFKAGMMAEAATCFKQIADAPEAPRLIQACSLNMAGQVARLQGDNRWALDAFGRLAGFVEELLATPSGDASDGLLSRLWCAALIGRGEICEFQKDPAAAAQEYRRLLHAPAGSKNDKVFRDTAPLAMDRLSRLYLQEREVGQYLNLTAALITEFPAYPRAPVVELESLCVRALRDARPEPKYRQGAFYAPMHLIEYLRQARPGLPAQKEHLRDSCNTILNAVGQLCQKHQGTPTNVLLEYHYAWMLEAAGERDKAAEVLARVSCRDPNLPRADQVDSRDTPGETVAPGADRPHEHVLREYALIQHVTMLAERGDYDKALQRLATLPPDPDRNPHVSQLAESVSKSIQTLKREVPTNETRQHD